MEQNVKSQLEFISSHGRGLWLIGGGFYRVVTLANEEIDAGKEHDYPPIVTYEPCLDSRGRRYAITVEKFLKKAQKVKAASVEINAENA